MKLPFVIDSGLPASSKGRWQVQFQKVNRDNMEGLWRRTQSDSNKEESGKVGEYDQRRRLIHFFDKYDVVSDESGGCNFVLTSPWLWLCVSSPKSEIDGYLDQIRLAAQMGGWKSESGSKDLWFFSNGDLELKVTVKERLREDDKRRRFFPANYRHLEAEINKRNEVVSESIRNNVWSVLDSGFRVKDERGNPTEIDDLKKIETYFPMQLELGCGPSIECEIPPLNYLHQVYYVTDLTSHRFIFGPDRDNLLNEILTDTANFYRKASKPIIVAIKAKPSQFYLLVKELWDKGTIVGPVITNNFDGLCNYLGIPEIYVRKYDEVHITPKIDFDPRAKSLLVVGSHADRRKIQNAARKKGLKVIYVDPEGYYDVQGGFLKYPMESPQDIDLLIRGTADDFVKKWRKAYPGS